MLIRFEVANYRSVLDRVELSMVAADRDRDEARPVRLLGESLLPVAAVYGPNASGKSTVLGALAWLQSAVRDSLRRWDDDVPIEPFAFAGGADRPSEFAVEMVVDGVRFEYVLELDRQAVRYEGLFHYPERKRRRLFEREGQELVLQRGLGRLAGTRELLTPRTLALSAARRFGEPLVSGFADLLLAGQAVWSRPRREQRGPLGPLAAATARWFGESRADDEGGVRTVDEADRKQALALLQLADLGIDDVEIVREVLMVGLAESSQTVTRQKVRLLHRTAAGPAPLDLSEESEGTRTWFRLIGPLLHALRTGSLLLFDELDASLHPTLSAELIRLFHDPITNPAGAQLVFTSHDTSLLNHLNRDEVWLTEKGQDGSTRLSALAEFAGERVRLSQDLEHAYLRGRFGALPDVDRTAVLRSLGLIG